MTRSTFTPVTERFAQKIVGIAVKSTRLSYGQVETAVRRTICFEAGGPPADRLSGKDARSEAMIRQLVAQYRPRSTPASSFDSASASVN